MNHLLILCVFFSSLTCASGIFDYFRGELTLEAVREFDFSTLDPDQILVYGEIRRVPFTIVEYALENGLADIDAVNENKKNVLYYAFRDSDYEAARTLMACGAAGYFPAMYLMAKTGNLESFKMLLEHYKDVMKEIDFRSLLANASFEGHVHITRLLLETEELQKYKSSVVNAALESASKHTSDNTKIIELLLQNGARPTLSSLIDAFDFFDFDEEYVKFSLLVKGS